MPEEDPPSSSLRPSSFIRKLKAKQQPPASFKSQQSRRKHARSSSLNEFVSRILPSRREERGYTLRSQFQDDGTQVATDLVFGLPSINNLETTTLLPTSDKGNSGRARSSSPRQHEGIHIGPPSPMDIRAGVGKPRVCSGGSPKGKGKKTGSVGRLFGLKSGSKGGEGTHLQDHSNSTQDAQQPVEMPASQMEKPPPDTGIQVSKTQQMFEDKKVKREQRRSLRESDDFLGVQGANPRTGYWDASTGTSSSEPSQMSEETKRKLHQQARDIEAQKRKLEDAQMRQRAELKRVQALRDQKKKEKAEQKKQEVRARQRKHGKWRPSETGWSSVAEPELSPIIQSLAGSPIRETASSDRLFPMPTAINPTPYINLNTIEQQDYFGHHNNSPLQAADPPKINLPLSPPPNSVIRRKAIGSPPSRHPSPNSMVQNRSPATPLQDVQKYSQLPQSNSIPIARNGSPGFNPLGPPSTSPELRSFLDMTMVPSEGDQAIKRATATSYRSASTSQLVNRRPLAQNHQSSSAGKDITTLRGFPPVLLKDPITARIPLNSPRDLLSARAPPVTRDKKPVSPVSSITTSTTTTTGYVPLRPRPVQFDGPLEIIDFSQLGQSSLRPKMSQMPPRTSSHQNQGPNGTLRKTSLTHLAATATSSEHQLTPTKIRTARLCRMTSPGKEQTGLKSTPISMSMSPQTPEEMKGAAKNAALAAFQNSRHKAAIKKAKRQSGEHLSPPKLRKLITESEKTVSQAFMVVPKGLGDIGDPFRSKQDLERHLKRHPGSHAVAATVEVANGKEQDGFVVWHPQPPAQRKGSEGKHLLQVHHNKDLTPVKVCHPTPTTPHKYTKGEIAEIVDFTQKTGKGATSPIKKTPKPGNTQPSIGQVAIRVIRTIWWFVEPVFEPGSGIRRRWEQRRLTWQDIGLFVATAAVTSGMVLIIAILARIVATIFLVVKGVFRVLNGF